MTDKKTPIDIEKKRNMLLHYKREDIRKIMIEGMRDREVSARYDFGFGKRPDMMEYANDILETVQKGATSFHSSEERWSNPMQLSPNLRKEELDNLRIGWDLVLDIDCPYWEFSKIIAKLFLVALEENGVKNSVSIKFSGNKGFHIGVPYESFPKSINNQETKRLFPEAPRIIAEYLLDYIENNLIEVKENTVSFHKKKYDIKELQEKTGKSFDELTKKTCPSCKREIKTKQESQKYDYNCDKCEKHYVSEKRLEFMKCEKCGSLIKPKERKNISRCQFCKSNDLPVTKFLTSSIVEVDTVLISSRHLFRSEFSMHEKSGLVSVPFNPEKIEIFEKEFAHPSKVKITKFMFLDRINAVENEAANLFEKGFHHHNSRQIKENMNKEYKEMFSTYTREKNAADIIEEVERAIPEEYFPPCIKKGLQGLTDGKKRFMFLLMNFLTSAGYDHDSIEKILKEWNKKNPEPLRDVLIEGHLKYAKVNKKKVLPPNCDNKPYYSELGICEPDGMCKYIKNPVQYAKKRAKFGQQKERIKKPKREKIPKEKKEKAKDENKETKN